MENEIGRYRVLKRLTGGGMGETFLGVGPEGEQVVLKRLREDRLDDRESQHSFLRELRVTAALDHPNIARVVEIIDDPRRPVLVTEFIDGCSADELLKDAVARCAPLPVAVSCAIVEAAARGLDHAHQLEVAGVPQRGIVHRDVSPSNIMLAWDGRIKLIDFGIAKLRDEACATQQGLVKGKIAYMAPEQLRGEAVDARTDVFAMGVVLWELLANAALFAGKDFTETAFNLLDAEIRSPSAVRPEVASDLGELCLKALQREPGQRYQSARELERALRGWASSHHSQIDLPRLLGARFPSRQLRQATMANDLLQGLAVDPTVVDKLPAGAPSVVAPGSALDHAEPVGSEVVPAPSALPAPAAWRPVLPARATEDSVPSEHALLWRRFLVLIFAVVIALSALFAVPKLLQGQGIFNSLDRSRLSYEFVDSAGRRVMVSSPDAIPPAFRHTVRVIPQEELGRDFLAQEGDRVAALAQKLKQLERRIAAPSSAQPADLVTVLQGLVAPLLTLLVSFALTLWAISRLRDVFLRWTLRLLAIFLLALVAQKVVWEGAFGRSGLQGIWFQKEAFPLEQIGPQLQQHMDVIEKSLAE